MIDKLKDHQLLRIKDVLLIASTGLGVIFGIFSLVKGVSAYPMRMIQLENKMAAMETESKKHCEKYTPMVERNEIEVSVLKSQMSTILKELEEMNRKLDRMNGR